MKQPTTTYANVVMAHEEGLDGALKQIDSQILFYFKIYDIIFFSDARS